MTRNPITLVLALLLFISQAAFAQNAEGIVPEATVSGNGFTVQTLRDGEAAFGNRGYVWAGVPAALRGWQYTQTDGGQAAAMAVVPKQSGFLYAASAAALPGWKPLPKYLFHYSDKNETVMRVYRRTVPAGQSVPIPKTAGAGHCFSRPACSRQRTGRPFPSRPASSWTTRLLPAGLMSARRASLFCRTAIISRPMTCLDPARRSAKRGCSCRMTKAEAGRIKPTFAARSGRRCLSPPGRFT